VQLLLCTGDKKDHHDDSGSTNDDDVRGINDYNSHDADVSNSIIIMIMVIKMGGKLIIIIREWH